MCLGVFPISLGGFGRVVAVLTVTAMYISHSSCTDCEAAAGLGMSDSGLESVETPGYCEASISSQGLEALQISPTWPPLAPSLPLWCYASMWSLCITVAILPSLLQSTDASHSTRLFEWYGKRRQVFSQESTDKQGVNWSSVRSAEYWQDQAGLSTRALQVMSTHMNHHPCLVELQI